MIDPNAMNTMAPSGVRGSLSPSATMKNYADIRLFKD